MRLKLSFELPEEYKKFGSCENILNIINEKEKIKNLIEEIQIIDRQLEIYTLLNNVIEKSKYTIIREYAIIELDKLKQKEEWHTNNYNSIKNRVEK